MPTGRELILGIGIMWGIPALIVLACVFGAGYWIGGNSGAESAQGYSSEVALGSHEIIQTVCKYNEAIVVDENHNNKFVRLPEACQPGCPGVINLNEQTFVTIFEKADLVECEWSVGQPSK